MPGAYTSGLRNERHQTEKEELLSLAFVDYPGLVAMNQEQDGLGDQIFATYVGQYWNYSACHDIAAQLLTLFGNGAGPVVTDTATGGDAIAAARAAVAADNRVIKFDYGFHSFTLVAHNGLVDSLEGWAGGPRGCGGVESRPIYDSITSDDHKDLTAANARAAIADMRDNNNQTRSDAHDVLSQASQYGFESGQGVKALRVTVAQLDTVVNVRARLRGYMNTAKDWAARVQAANSQKAACWECFTIRSSPWLGWQSTVLTRWHQCLGCARTFCSSCGGKLQYHATQTWSEFRERACSSCGNRTRLL